MIGLSFMAALSVFAEKNTISSPDATLPLNLPISPFSLVSSML